MPYLKVVKSFAWAEEGIHVRHFEAGETYDVPQPCLEVATEEGWGEEVAAAALDPGDDRGAGHENAPETLEIPDDWQSFNAARMKKLAASLGYDTSNKRDAKAAIEAAIEAADE
jgi:hypothetical protein